MLVYLASDDILGEADRHAEEDHGEDVDDEDRFYPLHPLHHTNVCI